MKKTRLQQSDLEVSCFCLGTAEMGASVAKAEAFRQFDRFLEAGGNFIDTAHVYNDWVPGETARSEKVIGQWLKASQKRNEVILSTKGGHPRLETMEISRAVPEEIKKDLEESLAYLGVDTIDLYFLHRDNIALPAEELLAVLEQAKREGKIRYYGCSNWKLDRIREAEEAAKKNGFSGFICNQVMWSLAVVNEEQLTDPTLVLMDDETLEYQKQTKMNTMAYTSLAKGYFSKKIAGKAIREPNASLYKNKANDGLEVYLRRLEREEGISPMAASMAYLMEQDVVTVPIISFSSMGQLEEAIQASGTTLGKARMETLEVLRRG